MRRRYDGSAPPPELLVFDGREFTTAADWLDAWEAFHAARERWRSDRGLDVMPHWKALSDCPFDYDAI